jgi:plasmid replication initiation protein
MNAKKLTVCKANKLIEATYRLTLNETRVINACIAQVDSFAPLLTTDKFELSAKDFAKLFNISEDRAYSELQETTKTLYQRSLTIHNPDPTQPKLKKIETRWISTIGYVPEDGKIYLYFAHGILPFLSELKEQFTKYELYQIAGFKCIYSYRLYELLMQWKTKGSREIDIEWLKKHLELDTSYDRMDNLKRRVIDPAVKEINELTSYQVHWEQKKAGVKITHLIFTFSEKKSPEGDSEKPKRTAKSKEAKEKLILGVPMSEIEAAARVGESYEQAAARLNRKKETNSDAVSVSDLIAKAGIVKPQPAPVVSPSLVNSSLEVIKFFVQMNKENYLKEFEKNRGVLIKGVGVVYEADLKLAGLFD